MSALLRRLGKTPLTPVPQFQFGDVAVDFERREVWRAGVAVNLVAKELKLLRQLIDHRGQALSGERLLSRVWHDQPLIGPRTVDVHIAWLRQKLECNPQLPRCMTLRSSPSAAYWARRKDRRCLFECAMLEVLCETRRPSKRS